MGQIIMDKLTFLGQNNYLASGVMYIAMDLQHCCHKKYASVLFIHLSSYIYNANDASIIGSNVLVILLIDNERDIDIFMTPFSNCQISYIVINNSYDKFYQDLKRIFLCINENSHSVWINRYKKITFREAMLIQLLLESNSITNISSQLNMSVKEFYSRRSIIMKKMNSTNNVEMYKKIIQIQNFNQLLNNPLFNFGV